MRRKKVILSAGGTGGHLFPAQSVAEPLLENYDLLFVGGGLKSCRYFDRKRFAFEEIPAATLSFSKPLATLRGAWTILRGVVRSWRLLGKFSPDLVVGFGSFYTLPLLLAARLRRIPILLHEQNAIPGRVNRLFSSSARVTAITFPESAPYLKGAVTRVGFPMRKEALKENIWEYFGLEKGRPTLLIYGGSQGAAQLNALVLEAAERWTHFQILHFTGHEKGMEALKTRYDQLNIPHCVKPFEPQISQALHIADLAITRAGAGTIAELIAHEVPALLVPFPYASGNHQVSNGVHFVKRVGGGLMRLERELNVETLTRSLQEIENELEKKKRNIQQYKQRQRLQTLPTLIQEILDGKPC